MSEERSKLLNAMVWCSILTFALDVSALFRIACDAPNNCHWSPTTRKTVSRISMSSISDLEQQNLRKLLKIAGYVWIEWRTALSNRPTINESCVPPPSWQFSLQVANIEMSSSIHLLFSTSRFKGSAVRRAHHSLSGDSSVPTV